MERTMDIAQAAKIMGTTVKTLQRWEREGKLVPVARTPSNRRRYTESQLRMVLHVVPTAPPRRVVAYCRVSSAARRPDMVNQRRVLEQFATARGLADVEYVEEVGGGLNFQRKRFVALMDAIGRGEIATLVLAHRDRLTRFGFDWFAHHAALHGCELLVLNQERLSPEQEMERDLMTIVHCFSSRLYGLRNYRRQLRAALVNDHAAGAPDQD
jgi:predicted site-specific integrase-resolvase